MRYSCVIAAVMALSLSPSLNAAQLDSSPASEPGATSCGALANMDSAARQRVHTWIAGYASGAIQMKDGQNVSIGEPTADQIEEWTATYCADHPLDRVADLATALVASMDVAQPMPIFVMHSGDGGEVGARFVEGLRQALTALPEYAVTPDSSHAGLFAMVATLDTGDQTVAAISLVVNNAEQSFLASSIHMSGFEVAIVEGGGVVNHISAAIEGARPQIADSLAAAARRARDRAAQAATTGQAIVPLR